MELDESGTEKKNTRTMWIASIAIVVFLVGAMGINMLIHHDTLNEKTDVSSQSQTAPSQ